MPARSDLPLVQRQTAEQPSTTIAPQSAISADKAVASSQVQAVPSQPVAQRQVNEPPLSAVVPETTAEEVATSPMKPADVAPARSDRPLVQRQTAEQKPTATASQAPTSDDKSVGSSQVQTAPSQPVVQQRVSEPSISSGEPEAAPIRSEGGTPPVQAVQRHVVEVEAASSTLPETSTPTRDVSSSTKTAPPARSDMPLVQRHAVDVQPIEDEPTPVSDRAAGISERILARVASHEQVPAARLPALPLHQPVVQRVNAPEVKPAPQPVASQSVAAAPVRSAQAPLSAPVIQRTPTPVIQRTPAEPAAPTSGSGLIQRVENAAAEAPETSAPVDLDLWRVRFIPIIKHLLAVERDRRTSR